MSNKKKVDIVIVGAGLAGLTAALELKKHNYSYVVLEARSRLGGRIHSTISSDGVTVDLGAQWIGPHHKRMLGLIEEFGLQLVPTFRTGKTIYEMQGKRKQTNGKLPIMSPIVIADIMKMKRKIDKISREIPSGAPWTSKLAQQLDKITVAELIKTILLTKAGVSFAKLLIEEALCANVYEVSALDFLWCIRAAGSIDHLLAAEDYWIAEGAETLINRISDSLGETIQLNQPVQRVMYNEKKVTVYTGKESWQAKKVIVTTPPNLLTRISFDPPLPARRVQLSERAGLPSVIKLICVYERPFWREAGLSGTAYSDQTPVKLTIDSSPLDGRRGVLTILIGGDSARQIETLPLKLRQIEVKKALVRLFGEKAAYPIAMFEKDWSAEEWTRGGYATHFATGVISQFATSLTSPVGPIHWAGTETASEWRMYMEGAVQSSERVVHEVIHEITKE
ncbi:flavin monoamine oxidase family protein [Halalkalibacter kiskunsagensis]|uniref:Flavin monoamine oxidase family protein n=1 Tax=Halalkalibacter kiskunsagensis TaxID=1548599 RepID=A0ABV6KGL6_9BACI